ncbi:SDR family oxidoreductase [Mycobacterium sp. NPDC003323]
MTAVKKRITVVGASGLIGRQLVPLLAAAGHDVVEASRATGVDLLSGDGLDDALAGADVVIDVINSATPEDSSQAFFEQTSSNLAAGARRAGVKHYVVLSIVGADRLAPLAGYLRGKMAQEEAAAESGAPWTVVRATQFHELAIPITESLVRGAEVRAPVASIQTVDSGEVSAVLARVATGIPLNVIHEVGGPEQMPFAEMARAVLEHQGRILSVIDDPEATYEGLPVDDTTLVTGPAAELCSTRLTDWLTRR